MTPKTGMIEELAGRFSKRFLPQWTARSPNLQSMTLFEGNALDNDVQDSIRKHCPQFKSLTVLEWRDSDADEVFGHFLGGLRPNSLQYFEMISYSNIGAVSFSALGLHARSLTELKLSNLQNSAVLSLGALKECTKLQLLVLEDNSGSLQLEATQNDIFVEIVEWLSNCAELRDLTLKRFYDATTILAQVLTSPKISLTKLSLEGYVVQRPGSAAFHSSLCEQPKLQSLWLKGDGEDASPENLDIMVDSLCRLENIRELVLKDVSDLFDERHISRLALQLPLLEELWTSGGEIGEEVFLCFTHLRQLKSLTLYALTQLTCDNIIDFIEQLDEQNQKGFLLSLMASDADYDLTEVEQSVIRDQLKTKVDGKFDFVLWREAEQSESDSD